MQITIDKLVYGGEGLGRLAADEQGRAKAVFVPFVLPGETVEARTVESRPSFERAELVNIVSGASSARVEPKCPYFGRCGGCQYQHADYDAQLDAKVDIMRETLARTAKLELDVDLLAHSGEQWHYRNRARLKVRGGAHFSIGYYRLRSHELLDVRECPISSALINRAISAMWEIGGAEQVPKGAREVQFFANHDDSKLLVELYANDMNPAAFRVFADAFRTRVAECAGVVAFNADRKTEDEDQTGLPAVAEHGEVYRSGEATLTYRAAARDYRVSAGAFFQVNRSLIEELVETAIGDSTGRSALDLYAGAGLFTLPLSDRFAKVTAVEASPVSSRDLRANGNERVRVVAARTDDYLRDAQNSRAEFALVDPPRAGLGERASKLLAKIPVSTLVYVSCDPSTLSRDLRTLLQSGFRVEQAHLFDLFPQTYHMESVFRLVR